MKQITFISLCLFLSFSFLVISAQSNANLVKEGLDKYQAGDYNTAVTLFSKAIDYALVPKDKLPQTEVSKEKEVSVHKELYIEADKEKRVGASTEKYVTDSKEYLVGKYISEPLKYLGENLGKLYFYRGRTLMQLGKYQEALNDFDKSVEAGPSFVEVYFRRALANHKLSNKENACKDLNKAIELGHQSAKVLFNQFCK